MTHKLGPDVADTEILHDSHGRVIDDDYVETAVTDALSEARRRGRPSLSQSGETQSNVPRRGILSAATHQKGLIWENHGMPTDDPGDRHWDFFIAHASPDAVVAARLDALLKAGGATVFLYANEVLPGDVWPRVLAQAQQSSMVTVVLMSNHTAAACYQLEELAAAIAMSRRGPAPAMAAPSPAARSASTLIPARRS